MRLVSNYMHITTLFLQRQPLVRNSLLPEGFRTTWDSSSIASEMKWVRCRGPEASMDGDQGLPGLFQGFRELGRANIAFQRGSLALSLFALAFANAGTLPPKFNSQLGLRWQSAGHAAEQGAVKKMPPRHLALFLHILPIKAQPHRHSPARTWRLGTLKTKEGRQEGAVAAS